MAMDKRKIYADQIWRPKTGHTQYQLAWQKLRAKANFVYVGDFALLWCAFQVL